MIIISEAQVTGGVLMALLAIMLFSITCRRLRGVPRVSAWLMGAGCALASLQFLLQHTFRFHDVDPTLGLTVNLALFMPTSYLVYLSLLQLMRGGHLKRWEVWTAPVVWVCTMVLTFGARLFSQDSARDSLLLPAIYIGAATYTAMLIMCYGRLEEWIEAGGHLQKDLSIKMVGESCGLTVQQIRQWLAATDRGMFSQWLSSQRVKHAECLLTEQPLWTLDAISDECGFANRQVLTRAFRRENGCNPSEWAGRHLAPR